MYERTNATVTCPFILSRSQIHASRLNASLLFEVDATASEQRWAAALARDALGPPVSDTPHPRQRTLGPSTITLKHPKYPHGDKDDPAAVDLYREGLDDLTARMRRIFVDDIRTSHQVPEDVHFESLLDYVLIYEVCMCTDWFACVFLCPNPYIRVSDDLTINTSRHLTFVALLTRSCLPIPMRTFTPSTGTYCRRTAFSASVSPGME